MPGDELHEEAAAAAEAVADARRARTGPRHAAPKKPLLTRLHMPAGKAIAMAAMPSAVLMSMGLTPQLATAKPLPKNPFKEGPCVSAPDKEGEEAQREAEAEAEKKAEAEAEKKKAAEEARRKAEAEKKQQEEAERKRESSEPSGSSDSSDASGDSDSGSGSGDGSGADSGSSQTPEPEPSPAESERNPLDPLGLGDKLRDALTPEEEKAAESAEPEPSPSESGRKDATDPVGDTADEVGKGVEDTTGTVEDTIEGVKDKLPGESATPKTPDEEQDGDDAAPDEEKGAEAGADGKEPFPCVEEKKVEGEGEQTPATLPNQPWELKASSLALHGLDYKGVYNVRTADGRSKQVLKFTADSVDIGDLHQIVAGEGVSYHVRAAPGSTSTIRGGQVTMYTEKLQGNLFGLIPIVFDPEHPPPLNLPEVYFTKVSVQQAGQFGGNLTVPGLRSTIE